MNWDIYFDNERKNVHRRQKVLDGYRREARARVMHVAEFLAEQYNVQQVVLFGSLLRGGFGADSDIDLAVRGLRAEYFFKAYAEAEELTFPFQIDLIDLDQEPRFWKYVQEVEVIYDSCERKARRVKGPFITD